VLYPGLTPLDLIGPLQVMSAPAYLHGSTWRLVAAGVSKREQHGDRAVTADHLADVHPRCLEHLGAAVVGQDDRTHGR
jgi:hypothetical protein